MPDLEALYRQIGRQYVLNYAAIGSGIGRLKPKNCKTGFPCGYSCISKNKNCKSAIDGQAKTYADWLTSQATKPIDLPVSTQRPDGQRNDFAESWRHSFANSPEPLKEVLRVLDDPEKLDTNPKDGAFHREGAIAMGGYKPETIQGQSVWRHEVGHYIDRKISGIPSRGDSADPDSFRQYFSSGKTFNDARLADQDNLLKDLKALKTEVRDTLGMIRGGDEGSRVLYAKRLVYDLDVSGRAERNAAIGGMSEEIERKRLIDSDFNDLPDDLLAKRLFQRIPEEVKAKFDEATIERLKLDVIAAPDFPLTIAKMADGAFSGSQATAIDMIGATTKNKIGFGHSTASYKKQGVTLQNSESFANINALYGTGDRLAVEVLNRLVPNQFKAYQKALEEAVADV